MFCSGEDSVLKQGNGSKIKKIENYMFKYSDKVGEGNFSQVYSGIDENSGECVAVKVIQASSIKSKVFSMLLQNQIAILKNLDHPNVIRCFDVLTSVNNCYIITEYCEGGDLEKLLKKNKRFDEKDITKFVYDIYKGLQYLASMNIIHRDLKIANIFLDSKNNAKIADLGFAVKSSALFKDMSIGSPIYMSPEGLINHEYGPKTDVWSFGVLLYELIHGDTPLSYCKTQEQLKQGVILPPKMRVEASHQLKEVIKLCMNPCEKNRISTFELHQTPYIRKVTALVEGIKMSKELGSTYCTSQKNLMSMKHTTLLFNWILSYEETLALIHYCRLLHKTIKQASSMVLSQWLLTISSQLCRATIDSRCQKARKVSQVLSEYDRKYQKQHMVLRVQRTADQALIECNTLVRQYSKNQFFQALLKETEILRRYLKGGRFESFVKYSQAQTFLSERI